ncbi:MAG: ABC transporter ATP-binding protein [Anaerolineaceae bacterium]|nr:ABC transporter ATP-binding protein [Anaerolineaceae bacterium]
MTEALRCERLTKTYASQIAIQDLSFAVSPGEWVTLLGPSGCGKTTTLRLIMGFEQPDRGRIFIDDEAVVDRGMQLPPEKRSVGMVFQEYALFPHLTAQQNIAFGIPKHEQPEQRVYELLELMELEDYADRYPHELSGGQQQRVALARALAPAPRLILLDEPFSNLDFALRAHVRRDVLRILKEANATCIFVTHDQQEAFSLSTRVAVMMAGHIAQMGTPSDVYLRPNSRQVANFVTEANYLPGEATGYSVDCLFGRLPLVHPQKGPVDVMIHPEQVELNPVIPDDSPTLVLPVVVSWNEYYGHDQRIGLRTAEGTEIVARSDSISTFPPQSVWHARVTTPVLAFSRAVG